MASGDGMSERRRPWWMTGLAIFCAATVAATIPSDLFIEKARDVEVWGGFELHGWAAMVTAPIHWTLYALGAWAFWTARPWAPTAAAAYLFYVAISHLVWSEASPHGRGWQIGLFQAVVIAIIGLVLLRARSALPTERRA
jgi:hypothetical protein